MKQLIVALMAVFFLTNAFAGDDVKSKKMAELKSMDEQTMWTLASMTCGDVFDLFEDATPGDKKDPDEVMAAQDDVLDLIIWIHGYLSGRNGIDNSKYTLNKAGINRAVDDIAAVCKSNEKKRLLDVVPNIK